jgi:hypothetical protein
MGRPKFDSSRLASCLMSAAAHKPAASALATAPGDNSHRDTLPTDHGTTAIRYRAAPIAHGTTAIRYRAAPIAHGAAANCYGAPAIRCTPAANCYGRQGISRNTSDGQSGDRNKRKDPTI